MRLLIILLPALALLCMALPGAAAKYTWWQSRDMIHCGGDSRHLITFDGVKSIVKVPGDNQPHTLSHSIAYSDHDTDEFVVEFGDVSPWINWTLRAVPFDRNDKPIILATGAGGGKIRVALSKMDIPNYVNADMHLVLTSEKEGTAEILRWAVETPHKDPSARQKAKASKALVNVLPLERGMIPHWNDKIGSFVCAYNQAHQEHYNYWLEDEGELLWSLGNYPEMMELYGKGLAKFIIKYSKAGAPVRKVVDKPVSANPYLGPGKFDIDTGLLTVVGELKDNPYLHLFPSVYERGGLLAAIGDFFISYKTESGTVETLKFDHPTGYGIDYNKPKKNNVRLTIKAANERVNAEITFDVWRGRVTARLNLTGGENIREIKSGFRIRDVDRYYKSPINSLKQSGDVALLYSEQPALEHCNIIRIAGPVSRSIVFEREGDVIRQADASGLVLKTAPAGKLVSVKLADINAGSTSFADKIEMYFGVDYADAEISMSYVGTYPLLGLATYSYRYPNDKEARELTDRMMDNFFAARKRLRDRELGYLLWVLNLMGRDDQAKVIADQIEEYVAPGQTFDNSQNSSAMAIGLRSVGRWEAADRICSHTITQYGGVNAPTDFLGFGGTMSQAASEGCYKQISDTLRQMYWDAPDKITAHSDRVVEEGPEEVQAYALVSQDLIWRLYGGFVPVRLDYRNKAAITKMSYDASAREYRASVMRTGDIDVFTSFRAPKKVQWNGKDLEPKDWTYNKDTGVVYLKNLSGEGDIAIAVDGEPIRPKSDWKPIDYIGLGKR